MAGTSRADAPGPEWRWNGEQWLWWNGAAWQEAGVGRADTGQPAGGNPSEPIRAIIPNLCLQAGFMGSNSQAYSLVITDTRLVFARVHDRLMADLARNERSWARTSGQGLIDQWAASFNAWDTLEELLRQRGPDLLLTDDPANFAVARADITKVKLRSTGSGQAGSPRLDYLILHTAGTKYKLLLPGGKDEAQVALTAAGLLPRA